MTNISVMPLFSSPVIYCEAPFDTSTMLARLKNEDLYPINSTTAAVGKGAPGSSMGSENLLILNEFPLERQLLVDCFHAVCKQVFLWDEVEFKITTSWLTKAMHGSCGHYHAHLNSVFSGVLYFGGGEGFAPIEFERNSPSSATISLPTPTISNIYNSDMWAIQPEQNALIFFPSYLRHRVGLHLAQEPRYSLAFNLFPTGNLGQGDSQVGINLLQN